MSVDIIARGIAAGRVPITAYDMAVAGGYVGTKEEFEADMGNSGTNATNAANSAAAAEAAADRAVSVSDDIAQYTTESMTAPANISAGEYILAAGTLYRATANIASGSTLTPNGNVVAVTVGEELTKVIASDAQKADADGTSPNLTAGNALQLVSTVGIEDQVPYNFRTSGGTADIGDREEDMVVGGTLAWNQQIQNGNFADTSGWSVVGGTISAANNVLTFTAGSGVNYSSRIYRSSLIPKLVGHKILFSAYVTSVKRTKISFGSTAAMSGIYNLPSVTVEANVRTRIQQIGDVAEDTATALNIYVNRNTVLEANDTIQIESLAAFDLTQMFGSTIADYIYSLEQANAGDGVAWFKKLFPKDYYAYDTGSLQSVKTSAHKMVGFNALQNQLTNRKRWSASGEYVSNNDFAAEQSKIKIIPGATYCFAMPNKANTTCSLYLTSFDANQNFVKRGSSIAIGTTTKKITFTAPEDAAYIGIDVYRSGGFTDSEIVDANLNLSWDGEKDGTYEPYVEYNYPLDDSLILYGFPKLDENNRLYYDGDTYESDGTVTRKFGMVDLGTLSFTYRESAIAGQYVFAFALPSDAKAATGAASTKGIVCPIYTTFYSANTDGTGYASFNMSIYRGSTRSVYIRNDDYTDAAAFKTAMSGVYVIYELETPTTETAEPYTNPQIVNDFGTEEYIDAGVEAGTRDVAIPVGHETFYQANLRAKLEMSPDSPSSGDGLYAVRQTNGANAYELLVFPDELPPYPSADGTFVLKVTVADGTPTLSWVSE